MERNRRVTILAAALFGGALALPISSHAADSQQSSQSGQQQAAQQSGEQAPVKLTSADRKFLMGAAQGGMLEVESGRLALEKASSKEVKDFAQQLVQDHADANEKLMQIAQDKGIELPKKLDAKHRQKLDKLAKLEGAEFDRAYMSEMGHKDHRKDIQAFEKQARQGKDPELKVFAEETLPVLQKHLSMAQKVQGGSASAEAGGGAASSKEQKQ